MTNENRRQILDMLAQQKISVEEADRLLSLIQDPAGGDSEKERSRRPPAKYLRVVVEPDSEKDGDGGGERVNIRVPMGLIRAGVKLAGLIPSDATARVNESLQKQGIGIDLGNLSVENLEELVDALADLEVDVQDGKQKVRVYVE
ncbi:MAG: hypothetical protein BZY88_04200 [SAR202 cluster bacterium Io17-Chloro-G9]|nr:MAG: hypothetical protein BZY88_04200 [SAR202 cluster bacterium Io17-Chloro-G9]